MNHPHTPLFDSQKILKSLRHLSMIDMLIVVESLLDAAERERQTLLGHIDVLNSQVGNLARIATRQQDHMIEMERRDRTLVDFFQAVEADHAEFRAALDKIQQGE